MSGLRASHRHLIDSFESASIPNGVQLIGKAHKLAQSHLAGAAYAALLQIEAGEHIASQAPSLELHRQVRAGFIAQGTSLQKWCEDNDILPSNARDVLIGRWNGPKGQALRNKIVKASGARVAA